MQYKTLHAKEMIVIQEQKTNLGTYTVRRIRSYCRHYYVTKLFKPKTKSRVRLFLPQLIEEFNSGTINSISTQCQSMFRNP